MNKLLFVLLQAAEASPAHGILFASDKIYTVLAVVLIIWVGVALFLIRLNWRISCLEKLVPEPNEK